MLTNLVVDAYEKNIVMYATHGIERGPVKNTDNISI